MNDEQVTMNDNRTEMAHSLTNFIKDAPVGFCPREQCEPARSSYKYFVCGKGCTLGVLFEDSINIYFEWLSENGQRVDYGPELRYRSWPKREFARLLSTGVWEPVISV